MPARGLRGGARGARAGRGGGGGSAAAEATSRASLDESADQAQSSGDGDVVADNAPESRASSGPYSSRAPADSNTQSSTTAPSTRGASKFKPKAVRRDATERQKLEQQRQSDLAKKIKVEEREQRDADRRLRRERGIRGGRGGESSRGGMIRRTVTGTGPFSAVPNDNVRAGGGGGSGGWGSGFKSGIKGDKSDYGYAYPDRRANEVRINIDAMRDNNVAQEHDAGPSTGKQPSTLPMTIIRVEHKDEEVKVATSAELEAEEQEDDENLFVDEQTRNPHGPSKIDDNEVWHAAPPSKSEDVKVKPEPGTEEEDGMDIDEIPAAPKAPPSPELQKKSAVALDAEAEAVEKAKEIKREKAIHDPEVQHAANDARDLLAELSLEEKGGRLYLFQFPPVLPPLLNMDADGNVDISDDVETNGPKVKTEPGLTAPQPIQSDMSASGGYIGKLNVRKSGKVELDYGGFTLDLGLATATDFHTTAILVDEQENDLASGAGKATGLGPVYSKFVLTPVFNEEEDWEPDLDGLSLGC